jgi:hypothetical protein
MAPTHLTRRNAAGRPRQFLRGRLGAARSPIIVFPGIALSKTLRGDGNWHEALSGYISCSHDLISNRDGQVHGVHHDDQKGDAFLVDLTFHRADPREFDGVLLPGGVIDADRIRMITQAQTYVQRCDADDKPNAVICHGPWLLVSATREGLFR